MKKGSLEDNSNLGGGGEGCRLDGKYLGALGGNVSTGKGGVEGKGFLRQETEWGGTRPQKYPKKERNMPHGSSPCVPIAEQEGNTW